MSHWNHAVIQVFLTQLRKNLKEWREGSMDAEDAMYDLEGRVDEIWGDEA